MTCLPNKNIKIAMPVSHALAVGCSIRPLDCIDGGVLETNETVQITNETVQMKEVEKKKVIRSRKWSHSTNMFMCMNDGLREQHRCSCTVEYASGYKEDNKFFLQK